MASSKRRRRSSTAFLITTHEGSEQRLLIRGDCRCLDRRDSFEHDVTACPGEQRSDVMPISRGAVPQSIDVRRESYRSIPRWRAQNEV
jgi:hypothetical protein